MSLTLNKNIAAAGVVTGGGDIDAGTRVTVKATTNPGYLFIGWCEGDDIVSVDENYTFTMGEGVRILEARWGLNRYTITFNSNGGSEVSSITALYGDAVEEPSKPTKSGYEFVNWYTDDDLEEDDNFDFTNLTMPAENITIYAKWTAKQYAVNLSKAPEAAGTVSGGGNKECDSKVTVTAETNVGYTFVGWFEGNDLVSTNLNYTFTMGSAARTLQARWNPNRYTIRFNSNGGSQVNEITQDYTTSVIKPIDPTRKGYTFAGWYTDADLEDDNEFDFTNLKMPANDVTIYAKWTADQYVVNLSKNIEIAGTVFGGGNKECDSQVTVTAETNAGYTFIGWFEGNNIVSTNAEYTFTMPAGIRNIQARWTVKQYTVSFNSNGGSAVSSITDDYGATITEPIKPTKTGYTFVKWCSDEALESEYIFNTIPLNGIMLYAEWSINRYTLTLEQNLMAAGTVSASSGIGEDGKAEYNSNVKVEVTTNSGYSFAGWYEITMEGEQEIKTLVSTTTPYEFIMPASEKKLRAFWAINPYYIELSKNINNAGTVSGGGPKTYGSTVEIKATTTDNGYTFIGWYENNVKVYENAEQSFGMSTAARFLEARWEPNKYDVTLSRGNNSAGTVMGGGSKEYNSKVTIVATTNLGYTFDGWYENGNKIENAGESYTFTMPSSIREIEARWNVNKYDVTIAVNEGMESAGTVSGGGTNISYGDSVTVTAETNPGYSFVGWYEGTDMVSTNPSYQFNMPANSRTLVAHWSVNRYTIAFNSNGGTQVNSITEYYGTTINEPIAPTKEGHAFGGWYSNPGLTQAYTFDTMPAGSITVYAKWTKNKYNINLSKNPSQAGDVTGGGESIDYDTSVTVSVTKTNAGYTFVGWYENNKLVSTDTSYQFNVPANSRNLVANWSVNRYTITFNSNGGTQVNSITEYYGTTINAPVAPTKEGHAFGGWYSNPDLTQAYTFDTMPASDTTLYVKWTANSYAVNLSKNIDEAGTVSGGGDKVYGTNVIVNATTEAGYTFIGWYEGEDIVSEKANYSFTMGSVVRNLQATWSVNRYTISFISNGGSQVTAITQDYKTAVTKPNNPTKTGHTFGGWYSHVSLTENYAFSFTNLTMPASDTTLFAKWTTDSYAVNLSKNIEEAGTVSGGGNKEYGSQVTVIAETNAGYTFIGWYEGEDIVSEKANYSFTMGDVVRNLQARWSVNRYTISFNSNGGSQVTAIIQDYKTAVTKPDNPTKTGHTFGGWYSDVNLGNDFAFDFTNLTMPANDTNLYAKWTKNKYNINTFKNPSAAGTVTDAIQDVEYDTAVAVVATTNTGYAFMGWYENNKVVSTELSYQFNVPANDRNLTATWQKASSKVNFDVNGGNESLYPVTIMAGDNINFPVPTHTDTSLAFAGWYTSLDFDYTERLTNEDGIGYESWLADEPNKTVYARWMSATLRYRRVNNAGEDAEDGDFILFGEWPQTIKDNSVVILHQVEPRGDNLYVNNAWDAGIYYLGSDDEYYVKETIDWDVVSGLKFSNGTVIESNKEYFFKVEPIKWRILKEENGSVLLLCDSAIERREYGWYSVVNFQNSDIRKWLNSSYDNPELDFGLYTEAFTSSQRELIEARWVDNSTSASQSEYACDNTLDKVFLPSYSDLLNEEYGFSTDAGASSSRQKKPTDLALAYGAFYEKNTSNPGYGYTQWWTRSIRQQYTYGSMPATVCVDGSLGWDDRNSPYMCVAPALWMSLIKANPYVVTVDKNIERAGTVMGAGHYFSGDSVTLEALTNPGYTFYGWYDGETKISTDESWSFTITENKDYEARWLPYQRVDANSMPDSNGGYILFGEWPQTEELNPEENVSNNIIGNLGASSEFTEYYVGTDGTTRYVKVDDSYFKVEPIKWRILNWDTDNGVITGDGNKVFLLCEDMITRMYNSSGNKYSTSSIRNWLINKFYNTAFITLQQQLIQVTTVNNSAASTGDPTNPHYCANTTDKVFLLSNVEANSCDVETRKKKPTDYAFKKGVTKDADGYGSWWLRSPYNLDFDSHIQTVEPSGDVGAGKNIYTTTIGAVPALWLSLPVENQVFLNKNIATAGTVAGGGTKYIGNSVTITATTKDGYEWDGWYDENNTKVSDGTNRTYAFIMQTGNRTFQARWKVLLTVNKSIDAAGTVTGGGYKILGDNVTVQVTGTNSGYTFDGWYNNGLKVSGDITYVIPAMPSSPLTLEARWYPYQRVEADYTTPNPTAGTHIIFGEWPQSAKGASVTIPESATPISTGRYAGYYEGFSGEILEGYYAKVTTDADYYFKVEPLKWKILNITEDVALILCESIIANQEYDIDTDGGGPDTLSNKYDASQIRAWLNNQFYTSAFSSLQQQLIASTLVDNSDTSTGVAGNAYACDDTKDNVFLLSFAEAISEAYGFSSSDDETRKRKPTAYSIATGADSDASGNGVWWLRSPSETFGDYGRTVKSSGETYYGLVSEQSYGVLPALRIELRNSSQYMLSLGKDSNVAGTVSGGGNKTATNSVTITATTNFGYFFDGWYEGETRASTEASWTFDMPAAHKRYEARWTVYQRVNGEGNRSDNGEYILFGYYPQTYDSSAVVSGDTETVGELTYCLGTDGKTRYVKVNSGGTDYYYKVEPIKWRILNHSTLETDANKALILSEKVLTKHVWDPDPDGAGPGEPSNNYELSAIRDWLNDGFYNSTFTSLQKGLIEKATVDNSWGSTGYGGSNPPCSDTQDYIFIPSYSQVSTAAYGFPNNDDNSRKKVLTDYSRKIGTVEKTEQNGEAKFARWWLRSPYYDNTTQVRFITENGWRVDGSSASTPNYGVVPGLVIDLS